LPRPDRRRAVAAAAVGSASLVGFGVVLHLGLAPGAGLPEAASASAVASTTTGRRAGGRSAVRSGLPTLRGPRYFCRLAPGASALPAGRRHGLAHHLRQYPKLALARPGQIVVARRLLAAVRTAALDWRSLPEAEAAGFDTRTAKRAAADRAPHYLHAESRRFARDGRYLDPRRPEALIYANVPGRPLVLIGVMFSMPRGIRGPTPAGPITRWHFHRVCARGRQRGLQPRADGSCPRGERLGEGSEMLHVWFTGDLRSAYAIHAPVPELCSSRLLPPGSCAGGLRLRGM
jgi:hypothetical protein